MALACVPGACLVAIPVALVARKRALRDLRPGSGLAVGAIAVACLWVFVGVLALTGGVAGPGRGDDGEVTGQQEVSLFDLEPGDCLSTLPSTDEDQSLVVIPCGQRHVGEVFATTKLKVEGYPGQDGVEAAMDRTCSSALEAFIGGEPTGLLIGGYYPAASDWAFGRRSIICIASRDDGSDLAESLRDSGGLAS